MDMLTVYLGGWQRGRKERGKSPASSCTASMHACSLLAYHQIVGGACADLAAARAHARCGYSSRARTSQNKNCGYVCMKHIVCMFVFRVAEAVQ